MVSPARQLPDWLRALYPFTPRRFATGAGALSYLDEGAGEEAVLMVHGNPTWSFFYRDLVQELSGRFRCIVPDHLGCGLSDKPQDHAYTLPGHIANLTALVRSLGLRRVHLVVHDWGGPIGLGTLLPLGDLLGRVVILNTAAFADTVIPWRIRVCRWPGVGELLVRGANGFAGPAAWMAVRRALPPDVRRGFLFPYDNWANRIATHRFVRDIPVGRGTPTDVALAALEARLPELRGRAVRLVWGGRDFCFNRHYLARWRAVVPAAAVVEFPEAGHYVLEDGGPAARAAVVEHLVGGA